MNDEIPLFQISLVTFTTQIRRSERVQAAQMLRSEF